MKFLEYFKLSDKHDKSHGNPYVKEELGKIFLVGNSSKTKEEFYRIMEDRVVFLQKKIYENNFGEGGTAHFEGRISIDEERKMIENMFIYINRDAFIIDGIDYSDLIPIVIRHEVAEIFTYAKNGYSFSPTPNNISNEKRKELAHGLALREEYDYAFELGKADRYLSFIKKRLGKGHQQIQENIDTYNLVKRRHG